MAQKASRIWNVLVPGTEVQRYKDIKHLVGSCLLFFVSFFLNLVHAIARTKIFFN